MGAGVGGQSDASDPLNLQVAVPGAGVLGPQPQAALKSRVEAYAADVLSEASRYEILQRTVPEQLPEFTSKHIADADDAVRRRFALPAPKRSTKSRVVGGVAVYATAAGVGVGGNQLDETWGLVLFVACLVAGLFIVGLLETGRGGPS
jgi:hypothetical protein